MRVFLLLILFLLLHSINGRTLPEHKALLGTKSAITDDPQASLSSWTTKTHHCTWAFITCSSSFHHQTVGSLDISGLNLTGILSPDIGFLTNLQNLSVSANAFSGPIPPSIFLLTELCYLNLSNNIFNESFPSSLSSLKKLNVLDFYNNNLTGVLPLTVVEMPELWHLHLGGNYFSGEIGNLSSLKELYIGYYNGYSGGIPPEIGNLTELVRFDGANCGLSGEIPKELGKLQKLDTLFLQVNTLSGSLPSELGSLSSLKSMDLSNNLLSGEIHELGVLMVIVVMVVKGRNGGD